MSTPQVRTLRSAQIQSNADMLRRLMVMLYGSGVTSREVTRDWQSPDDATVAVPFAVSEVANYSPDGAAHITNAYSWKRGPYETISGAASNIYTPVAGDVGRTIQPFLRPTSVSGVGCLTPLAPPVVVKAA